MYLFRPFEKYGKFICIIYIICSILSYAYLGRHQDGRIALLWVIFAMLAIVHIGEVFVRKYFKWYKIFYINAGLSVSIALLLYFIFTIPLQTYVVKTASMEPTIHTSNLVIVNKMAYLSKEPQRSDIALIKVDFTAIPVVHRIIARENDIIRIGNRAITVNGKRIDFSTVDTFEPKTVVVPKDAYYHKGDNSNSYMGIVSADQILGKIIYVSGGPKNPEDGQKQ